MDPAGVGALLGFGIIGCLILSSVCYEKGRQWKEAFLKRWNSSRKLQTPLLPVTSSNPLLVRSNSKQWKVKETLPSK